MNIVDIHAGYANSMIPADAGKSLPELVRIALYNCDRFDEIVMDGEVERVGRTTVELSRKKTYRQVFEEGLAMIAALHGWSMDGCRQVVVLKKRCPPDRLYRVRGGLHSATHGYAPLGIVVSYRPGEHGTTAEAGIAVLGFADDLIGSAAKPLAVPAEALEDVTEAARAGSLPELAQAR